MVIPCSDNKHVYRLFDLILLTTFQRLFVYGFVLLVKNLVHLNNAFTFGLTIV